jgi:hypothetical protein
VPEILNRLRQRVVETFRKCGFRMTERQYRYEAARKGVQYIGLFEKQRLVLFQDPVTGSSFAVKCGESVSSGILRVRTRFGLAA